MSSPSQAAQAAALRRVEMGGRASTPVFMGVAGILVTAGGLVAAVNSAAPFARGSWLAAYLVLVGGVAQVLLAAGGPLAGVAPPSARRAVWELVLWNLGVLAVPLGVLTGVGPAVTVGSASLLAALVLFAGGLPRALGRAPWPMAAYGLLVVMLAASILVGLALADAPPLTWL